MYLLLYHAVALSFSQFIKETQRLYNPAFQPTRLAHKEVILPGGFIVPAGAQVTVALHSIHVNKEHWKVSDAHL